MVLIFCFLWSLLLWFPRVSSSISVWWILPALTHQWSFPASQSQGWTWYHVPCVDSFQVLLRAQLSLWQPGNMHPGYLHSVSFSFLQIIPHSSLYLVFIFHWLQFYILKGGLIFTAPIAPEISFCNFIFEMASGAHVFGPVQATSHFEARRTFRPNHNLTLR